MTEPACPVDTRLYAHGKVVAEGFAYADVATMLADHPEAVLWLDLFDPEEGDLDAVAADFHLHPLAIEDALQDHERAKLDRYPGHLFLNVYAVDIALTDAEHQFGKTELSAFITSRALITVRKSASATGKFVERWEAEATQDLGGGVGFLLWGLLDVIVDGHYDATQRLDEAMDSVEDILLDEGGAPREIRMRALHLRKITAAVRRAMAPMPEIVATAMRNDLRLVGEHLLPYYRDVEDHARHTVDQVEHLADRIEQLLQADLAEQGNELNVITRKLAAWAAIIAVPTAVTGYFGQNVPYWGYGKFWGFLLSLGVMAVTGGVLYGYLKKREWL